MVALFAGVVSFQSGGGRWRDVVRDFKLEAHEDSIAIREDATIIRDGAKSAPVELKMMGTSLSYHVGVLHAAAKAETRVAAIHLSSRPKDW